MKKLLFGAILAATAMANPMGVNAEKIDLGGTSYEFTRYVERDLVPGVKYIYFTSPRGTYGTQVWVTEVDLTNPNVKIEYLTAKGTMGGSTNTLSTIANNNTSANHTVVAGANANFWITTETPHKSQLSVYPFGTAVSNGLQYSINPPKGRDSHVGGPTVTGSMAIGTDGRAYIKRFNYHFYIYHPRIDHMLDLTDCNRVVEAGTASIYNKGYGRTKAFKPVDVNGSAWDIVEGKCTEILCDLAPGETEKAGGDVKYIIKEVRTNAGTGTLGNHDLAVVGRDSYATVLAQHYVVGDEIVLQQHFNSLDGKTADIIPTMYNATSGNDITMEDGVVLTDLINAQSNYNNKNYARTFYGTNADGTKLWIAVCGNKTGVYTGMTTTQMTYFLKALGATNTTQVDCGGSSQLYALGDQLSLSTDANGVRPVHSGVFVVYTGTIEEKTPSVTTTGTDINFGSIALGGVKSQTISINGENLKGNINISVSGANASQFSVSQSTIFRANQKGDITVNFSPNVAETLTAQLNITSEGTAPITLNLTGQGLATVNAKAIYQDNALAYGVTAPEEYTTVREYQNFVINEIKDKKVKRVIARGDIVYILAHDAAQKPTIVVFNHVTKKVVRTLGTTNATIGTPCVSDIAISADGRLVGMGYATQTYGGTGMGLTYIWPNDEDGVATGELGHWNVTNVGGNYTNAYIGESLVMQGDATSGKVIFTAQTTASSQAIRFTIEQLEGGKLKSAYHNNLNSLSGYTRQDLGDVLLFASPFNENNIIIQGNKKICTEVSLKSSAAGVPEYVGKITTGKVPELANHTGIFRYGGKIYMTTPIISADETTGANKNTGVKLYDITDGLDNGKKVTMSAYKLSSKETTEVATVGTTQITMEDGKFVEARLVVLAVRDGGISKFISESTIPGPVVEEPTLGSSVPSTVNFEEIMVGKKIEFTYNLEAMYLKDDITFTLEGEGFSVNPTTMSKNIENETFIITFAPTAQQTYTGKLTISSPEAEPIVVQLVGKGVVYDTSIEGDRSHHAYDLSASMLYNNDEPSGVNLHYTLTGDVKNVRIHLYRRADETEAVALAVSDAPAQPDYTFELGEKKAGENNHEIQFSDINAGAYDWAVEVESYKVSSSGKLFQYGLDKANAKGGVTVISDPNDMSYGKIITSNGYAQGFMIFSPVYDYEGTFCANTPTWNSTNQSSIYRIDTRDNGLVYAIDYSDSGAGIWCFDPNDPASGTYNIFSGTKDNGGAWTLNGTSIGGGGSGLAFVGKGEDTKLWVFQEDYPTGNASPKILCRYDIGTAKMIEKAPTTYSGLSSTKYLANNNVNIFVDEGHGMFLAQNRGAGSNTTGTPCFVYADFDGNVIFNSGSDSSFSTGSTGGIALSADRSLMAIGTPSGINLYNVTWDSNGKPSFSRREVVSGSEGTSATQLVFDVAGNLLAYQFSTDKTKTGLNVYAIADKNPAAFTAAPFRSYINATSTGVENINIDETSTTPVYYDIRGVRMPSGDNLAPGLYLKVTGKKVEKVRIK